MQQAQEQRLQGTVYWMRSVCGGGGVGEGVGAWRRVEVCVCDYVLPSDSSQHQQVQDMSNKLERDVISGRAARRRESICECACVCVCVCVCVLV